MWNDETYIDLVPEVILLFFRYHSSGQSGVLLWSSRCADARITRISFPTLRLFGGGFQKKSARRVLTRQALSALARSKLV